LIRDIHFTNGSAIGSAQKKTKPLIDSGFGVVPVLPQGIELF
jgi:hypothetical protein